MGSQSGSDENALGVHPTEENALQLRKALDEAIHAAQSALRDTTRLTRLFSILSEPAPLELMLDRVLSTLSELFDADIVVLLDPAGTGTFAPLAAVGLPEDILHLPMYGSAQLVQIVQSGREIGRHLEESDVCSEAVRMLPAVLWADAAVLVLNDSSGSPRCISHIGLDSKWASTWSRLSRNLLAGSSVAWDRPYATLDLGDTSQWLSLNLQTGCPVRALLAIPIQCDERIQVLLYAMRHSTSPFSPDTVQMAML